MTTRPRFSIVLPTIGRMEYLSDAIKSVCWQSFGDFELIISDNSDDGRVEALARDYAHDARVRYVRPPEQLNLPTHWEFASLQANGEFVFILQDRFVLLPNALRVVDREITRFSTPGLVYWPHTASYDHRTGRVSDIDTPRGGSELRNSRELLEGFARFEIPRTSMPHASNSFYHRDLAERIRLNHGPLFRPLAPDDAAGFLHLAYTEEVVFINQQLWIGRPTKPMSSTGHNAQLAGTRSYAASVGLPDFLRSVPLPVDTVLNCIIYDLLAVQRLVDPRLATVELDLEKYSVAVYREIVDKESSGTELDTVAMYESWSEFVNGLPHEARLRVRADVSRLGAGSRSRVGQLKRIARRLGIQPYLSSLKARLRASDQPAGSRVAYKTILEAASGIDSQQLSN